MCETAINAFFRIFIVSAYRIKDLIHLDAIVLIEIGE